MKLRTTDLDRLLASRPVNRQAAAITAGGVHQDDLPALAQPTSEPPPPPPPPRQHDPIGTRRAALTHEIRTLNVRLSASSDPAARRAHALRIGTLQRELNALPDQGAVWSRLLLQVAREQLDGTTWVAIEREARQRLVRELRR